jgi:hypothetical protein
MPKHRVMTAQAGHEDHVFDKADIVSVAEAEKRFKELTGKGFLAIAPSGDGSPGKLLKAFDPEANIDFQPQLMGG